MGVEWCWREMVDWGFMVVVVGREVDGWDMY